MLGADHHGYVARLQALAEMLGHPRDAEVLVYQLVHLVEGGASKKMSKRRGDVVFLDELLDAIGVDAARWYLVSGDTTRRSSSTSISRGSARTRTRSTTCSTRTPGSPDPAQRRGVGRRCNGSEPRPPGRSAWQRRSVSSSSACSSSRGGRQATERRAPHAIPIYAIRVADDFHRFYHEHRVLESEQEAFRLELVRAVQIVIARCLDLVGVDAPERM